MRDCPASKDSPSHRGIAANIPWANGRVSCVLCGGLLIFAATAGAAEETITLTRKYVAEHGAEWTFKRTVARQEPLLHNLKWTHVRTSKEPCLAVGEFVVERDGKVVLRTRSRVTVRDGAAEFEISLPWEEACRTTFILKEFDDDEAAGPRRVYRARINDYLIERYTE